MQGEVTTLLIALYLGTTAVQLALSYLNVRHRRVHGREVPEEFRDSIEPAQLAAISAYQEDRERFGLIQSLFWAMLTLGYVFGGGLEAYDGWMSRAGQPGILRGALFFVLLQIGVSCLELPFDAFSTFRIEQRHGFNRMSVGLFLADWVKGLVLGSVLVGLLSSVGLFVFGVSPRLYWFWFWGVLVGFSMLLMLIAPYVIEPLFIKTSPLKDDRLDSEVRALSERAGVAVSQVQQVDASRRTAHSNAYFTGIGRVKRVVLFDTLLQRLTRDEILAVLGHELGHWRLRHVTKRLIGTAALALAAFYLGARLLGGSELPEWFGMQQASVPARVILLAFLAQLVGFFFEPVSAALSRRHEWQADEFAGNLTGKPQHLAAALTKLAKDNLTNLHPHPLYSAFHHSHPAPVARIRKLRQTVQVA